MFLSTLKYWSGSTCGWPSTCHSSCPKQFYLWYCSLENKICHIQLCAVGGLYCDYSDTGVGVWPLKAEVNLQPILVVCSNWRDSCRKQKSSRLENLDIILSVTELISFTPEHKFFCRLNNLPSCSNVCVTLHNEISFPLLPLVSSSAVAPSAKVSDVPNLQQCHWREAVMTVHQAGMEAVISGVQGQILGNLQETLDKY